jgi:hypothetical protein
MTPTSRLQVMFYHPMRGNFEFSRDNLLTDATDCKVNLPLPTVRKVYQEQSYYKLFCTPKMQYCVQCLGIVCIMQAILTAQ